MMSVSFSVNNLTFFIVLTFKHLRNIWLYIDLNNMQNHVLFRSIWNLSLSVFLLSTKICSSFRFVSYQMLVYSYMGPQFRNGFIGSWRCLFNTPKRSIAKLNWSQVDSLSIFDSLLVSIFSDLDYNSYSAVMVKFRRSQK